MAGSPGRRQLNEASADVLVEAGTPKPPPCPPASQVLDAALNYLAKNGYRPRAPEVFGGSLRGAGPYVTAALISPDFPDGLRVLLRQEPDWLRP